MSTTLFSHIKCKGDVFIDVSDGIKLVSPSFQITTAGVGGLIIDLHHEKRSIVPSYRCRICCVPVDVSELSCPCMVCGREKPVGQLYTHERIAVICEDCVTAIKSPAKMLSEQIEEYRSLYGLNAHSKFIPMAGVLQKTVNL